MLNSFKSKAPDKDKNAVAEAIGNIAQPQHSGVEQAAAQEPTTKTGTASCIGSDMSIVGNIECTGPARVFGRIKGDSLASTPNDGAVGFSTRRDDPSNRELSSIDNDR
jgi:hypothetical protein